MQLSDGHFFTIRYFDVIIYHGMKNLLHTFGIFVGVKSHTILPSNYRAAQDLIAPISY